MQVMNVDTAIEGKLRLITLHSQELPRRDVDDGEEDPDISKSYPVHSIGEHGRRRHGHMTQCVPSLLGLTEVEMQSPNRERRR
jgi:hypothetical protein